MRISSDRLKDGPLITMQDDIQASPISATFEGPASGSGEAGKTTFDGPASGSGEAEKTTFEGPASGSGEAEKTISMVPVQVIR